MDNGYSITDLQYLYFISSKGTTLKKSTSVTHHLTTQLPLSLTTKKLVL